MIISFFIFIIVATYPFYAQYDVRINYLAIEFLVYPKEVFGMIITGYKLPLILAIVLIYIFAKLYLKIADFKDVFNENYFKRILLSPII